jgi:hypothetical protein
VSAGTAGRTPNRGHRQRKLTLGREKALFDRVEAEPDITLARLQDWLLDQHDAAE